MNCYVSITGDSYKKIAVVYPINSCKFIPNACAAYHTPVFTVFQKGIDHIIQLLETTAPALRFKGFSPTYDFHVSPTPNADFYRLWDGRCTFLLHKYHVIDLAQDYHITIFYVYN